MTSRPELALAPASAACPDSTAQPHLVRSRSAAAVIAEAATHIEQEGRLPAPVLAAMHDAALFRLSLPAWLGGAELPLAELAEITELIAGADASAGWCLGQALGCATAAAYLDPRAAEQVFGPRDAVLAWGAGAVGTAVPTDNGYRVSGTWRFASGSDHATWLGGHCTVTEPDGTPRTDAAGRPVTRTALFPRSAAEVHDDWHVVGLRGTRSEGYTVDDLVVEDAFTLNRDSAADRRSDATLFRFPVLHVYASVFAGVAVGNARAALDRLVELAQTKTARGAPTAMRDSPVVHSRLAELEARLGAARAFRARVLDEVWRQVEGSGEVTPAERAPLRLATTHAIHEATRVAEQAYRMAGATAVFTGRPFEQRLRDAYAISQQVQGRHENYELVGRHLVGLPVDSIFF
ncbi:MAG: acyl-CoA dehydrogenase family protein [Rhodospirillales bacterium]|nr:acyl-CoA dehydrogenase family protein [Rhodospirillales bacterium]